MTIGRWNLDLESSEAQEIFRRIQTEGVSVFRQQAGFVRYRLMRADMATTIAVAEWETEELASAGAQQFRAWLSESGIREKITMETCAGEIVAAS